MQKAALLGSLRPQAHATSTLPRRRAKAASTTDSGSRACGLYHSCVGCRSLAGLAAEVRPELLYLEDPGVVGGIQYGFENIYFELK